MIFSLYVKIILVFDKYNIKAIIVIIFDPINYVRTIMGLLFSYTASL